MNWKRAAIATAAAAPLIALLAYGFTRDPAKIPSPLPGKAVPDFALPIFTTGDQPFSAAVGDTIRVKSLRGKVVIVNFWASWCGPCRVEHAELSETARHYAGKPAQFVGILYSDSVSAALAWITDMGGQSYPALKDYGSRTAIDFGVYGVPETFIVDPSGRIAYKHVGPISSSVLQYWIDSLMPAANTKTKPQP